MSAVHREAQAEAIVNADERRREADKDLATKADLEVALAELETRLVGKIADQKTELIKWLVALFIGFFIAISVTVIGAVFAMFKLLPT